MSSFNKESIMLNLKISTTFGDLKAGAVFILADDVLDEDTIPVIYRKILESPKNLPPDHSFPKTVFIAKKENGPDNFLVPEDKFVIEIQLT